MLQRCYQKALVSNGTKTFLCQTYAQINSEKKWLEENQEHHPGKSKSQKNFQNPPLVRFPASAERQQQTMSTHDTSQNGIYKSL